MCLSYCSLCCHAYLFCITILVLFLLCSLCSQCSFGLYLFVLGLNVLDFLFFLFDCFLCFFSFCCQPFVDFLLYLFFGFCVWTLALLLKLTFFVFINLPASSCIVQLSMSKFLDVSANSAAAELLDASLFFIIIAYYCILQLKLFDMSTVRFPGSLQCSECRQSPQGPACRSDIPEAVSLIPGLLCRLTAWTPTSLSGCCSLLGQLCSPPTVHMKHSFIPV